MSSKKPKTQTVDTSPWKPSQKYIKELFAEGQTAKNDMMNADINSQDLIANQNETQTQGFNTLLGSANQIAGEVGGQVDALNRGINADNIESNPYFAASVNAAIDPAVKNFERRVLPQIKMNAVNGAGLGSSRQGIAEGLAMSDLNSSILNTTSQMADSAYRQGQQTSLNALNLAPQIAQQMLLPGNVMSQVGDSQQQQTQRYLDENMAKWNFSRTNDMDTLDRMASLLRGWNGGSTTQPAAQGANPMGSAIGGIGGYLVGGPVGGAIGGSIGGLF